MHKDVWEALVYKDLYRFIVRRSQQMYGGAPDTTNLFQEFGKTYLTELLGREESPITIIDDYITLKKWTKED